MKARNFFAAGCLAASILACGIPGSAAMIQTKSANDQMFSNRIQDIQWESNQAENDADQLKSFTLNPETSRTSNAIQLNALRRDVNEIGQNVYALEKIKWALTPWQREDIDRLIVSTKLMADNTEDAILLVNSHEYLPESTRYRLYTNNIDKEATALHHWSSAAISFMDTSKDYTRLGRELTKSS